MAGWQDRPGGSGDAEGGQGAGGAGGDEARQAARIAAARERFTALAQLPDREIDLAEGALLIAAEEVPDLDISAYQARLDEMGARVRHLVQDGLALAAGADGDEVALAALHTVLFEEEGFAGASEEEYYLPRNCLLSEVMDRKRGIPVTLAVVYCEVAQRAGLSAVGINLPGHFVVQFRGDHLSVYVSPASRGTRLTEEDCAVLAQSSTGRRGPLRPDDLRPASRKQILARILNNLEGDYIRQRQFGKALAAAERILIVQPSVEQVRNRGLILRELGMVLLRETQPSGIGQGINLHALQQAMGLLNAAWFDLKLYAKLAEGAADAGAVGQAAGQLWKQMGRLN